MLLACNIVFGVRAEELTYEQQLLQVWDLMGANGPIQQMKTKFDKKGYNPTDTLPLMMKSYFEERGIRDLLDICLPIYQEAIPQEELATVASILSDKRFRTIQDSINMLNELGALEWDSIHKQFVSSKDAEEHPNYWHQRISTRMAFLSFNLSVALGPQSADSVFMELAEKLESDSIEWPSEEWLGAYINYCEVNGTFNKGTKSLITIFERNPKLSELPEEMKDKIFEEYIFMSYFYALPEYARVATIEDLEYLTQLVAVEPYQHYLDVGGEIMTIMFGSESNIWCYIGDKMYTYMLEQYPENTAQHKTFEQAKALLCLFSNMFQSQKQE